MPEAGPEPLITLRGDRLDTVTQPLVSGQPVPFTQHIIAGGGLFEPASSTSSSTRQPTRNLATLTYR